MYLPDQGLLLSQQPAAGLAALQRRVPPRVLRREGAPALLLQAR